MSARLTSTFIVFEDTVLEYKYGKATGLGVKRFLLFFCLIGAAFNDVWGRAPSDTPPKTGTDLKAALKLMDEASVKVHSVQTDFEWDDYERVVNQHDVNRGVLYLVRENGKIQFAADVQQGPDSPKYVLYKDETVRVFLKGGVTEYDVKKRKAVADSLVLLGFGASGRDLQTSFHPRYIGTEQVGGTLVYQLELVPLDPDARNLFPSIFLWIDGNGIAVQQKIDKGGGDYRVVKYSNTQINPPKLPKGAFSEKR